MRADAPPPPEMLPPFSLGLSSSPFKDVHTENAAKRSRGGPFRPLAKPGSSRLSPFAFWRHLNHEVLVSEAQGHPWREAGGAWEGSGPRDPLPGSPGLDKKS